MLYCKKKKFQTQKEAYDRLNEINKDNGKKTMLRTYKCKSCEGWHLTSMTKKKYKNTKNADARSNCRTEKFILLESEYWEKKFKINL